MKPALTLSLFALIGSTFAAVHASPAAAATGFDGVAAAVDMLDGDAPVMRRGRGADDGPNHNANDDRGGRGKAGGKGRGRGKDDGPNHG